MRILTVIHASFEKPGSITQWAERNNHELVEVRPFNGEVLPKINDFDMLLVMGGPQSVLDKDRLPYLLDEVELIKSAIKQNKCIIGICLGSQLLADALGAKAERSPNREIGRYEVELLADAASDPVFKNFPEKFDVMHWHNDMPGLAQGAVLVAKSQGCPRQIYRYGDRAYGFQCHFELTKELVEEMIAHCEHDLKPAKYVMTRDELLAVDYNAINARLDKVLDYLASL